MTRESDLIHENAGHYIIRNCGGLTVYRPAATHAVSDSAYPDTADGLSIAKARVDYLARKAVQQ